MSSTKQRKGEGKRRKKKEDNREETLSKTLSYIVRHGAEAEKIPIDSSGLIRVEDFIARYREEGGYTLEEIQRMVGSNDKKRFCMVEKPVTIRNEEGTEESTENVWFVGAYQGHSLKKVENPLDRKRLSLEDSGNYPTVVHGTYERFLEPIMEQGLSKMERTDIHFAKGDYGSKDVISGMRSSCQVLIYIDLEQCLRDGIEFFESGNGVILTPGIDGILPPK